jgi:hypothetical protein
VLGEGEDKGAGWVIHSSPIRVNRLSFYQKHRLSEKIGRAVM